MGAFLIKEGIFIEKNENRGFWGKGGKGSF
jgi:hypothetical protein